MAEHTGSTDLSNGLVMAFGAITVLASLAVAGSSYLYSVDHDETMRVLSGLFLAVALVAAGVAVAAPHIYD